MLDDCLKLTSYFGERDRRDGRFLADALIDLCERHAFRASVLVRGIEGFGIKHHLHTQRLLSLSEDLPVVMVGVDTRPRVQAVIPELGSLVAEGLITLERARIVTDQIGPVQLPPELMEAAKLTVYCGRKEQVAGRPAYLAVVDFFRDHGVAGATVLLGVDGIVHGQRARARFFSRNAEVPIMIIAVGDGGAVARTLPALDEMLDRPVLTLERVVVCKRDGRRLNRPRFFPETDESGLPIWQKLMIYAGEGARHAGKPLYVELIHRLRRAGAAGATSVRGVWGYHGGHPPHGDRLFSLRRHVPVVTSVVDTPERIREWFDIVDELTDETGLVTSEMVPAARAAGTNIERGGLHLPRRWL